MSEPAPVKASSSVHGPASPETLSAQEEFLQLLSHLKEFVIILMDEEGKFRTWHPGVQQMFGYSAEEFIGQPVDILFLPTDRAKGAPAKELQTAATTGRASDTRWLIRKDGKEVFADGLTISLCGSDGELCGFGKVVSDVTERKNTEEGLRALARALDHSPVLIRTWDGTIEHWTAACERLYGWTAQEAVGKSSDELLRTQYPAPLETIREQILSTGTWHGDLRQVRRDGKPLSVSAQWSLLSDPAEKPIVIIATHTDISPRLSVQQELEKANERLTKMADELERSNLELEDFARIASHDLSAPLTSTRWLVDLMTSRYARNLDSDGQKCLTQIAQGLQRMSDLVEAVLAHARVGTRAISSSEAIRADEALAVAMENLRHDVEVSGAAIAHDPLPSLLIRLQPLAQLFQNLLSNAIKYRRPDESPRIRISAAPAGSLWRIGVTDNGVGIGPEWFDRIFQPMQRMHGSDVAGSGIGLATCKKIVNRAGGDIWVESEPGVGSTFYFTLPGVPDETS